MITADMIPEKVTTELREAWNGCDCDVCLAVAFAAAINAWPGMGRFEDETGWDVHIELPLLIPLPLGKVQNAGR